MLLLDNWRAVSAFVVAPKEYQVICLIRQDLSYGLLAKTSRGRYVRINGNCIERLDNERIEPLLQAMQQALPRIPKRLAIECAEPPGPAPVVTVRKRRTLQREFTPQAPRALEPTAAVAEFA